VDLGSKRFLMYIAIVMYIAGVSSKEILFFVRMSQNMLSSRKRDDIIPKSNDFHMGHMRGTFRKICQTRHGYTNEVVYQLMSSER